MAKVLSNTTSNGEVEFNIPPIPGMTTIILAVGAFAPRPASNAVGIQVGITYDGSQNPVAVGVFGPVGDPLMLAKDFPGIECHGDQAQIIYDVVDADGNLSASIISAWCLYDYVRATVPSFTPPVDLDLPL